MPHREPVLRQIIPLALANADSVTVHLNGYSEVPEYLANEPKVRIFHYLKNQGSIVRFAHLQDEYDYTFLLDDDLIPTQQFFDVSLEAAARITDGVVTFYGFNWNPDKGFRPRRIGANAEMKVDTEVMGFGVGISCIRRGFLPSPSAVVNNMNDISVGLHYASRGVRMVIPKHPGGLVKCISAEKLPKMVQTMKDVRHARAIRGPLQKQFAIKHQEVFTGLYNRIINS